MSRETLAVDYDEVIDEASFEMWLRPDGWLSSGRIVTDEDRQASQDRVDAILGQLPDDERVVMWAWMNADKRKGGDDEGLGARAAAESVGMAWATFQRKLKNAIKHAAQAAARFYETGDVLAPEQYIDDLAGVEVEPEDVGELVLNVYRELRSVRKTADQLGLNREKVRRIVSAAA